jgi:hypothetical protein
MAKPLRIVAPGQKPETNITTGAKLDGVKSSKESEIDISDRAKAKGANDFAKKHKVTVHADRVGNKDVPYSGNPEHYVLNSKSEKRHGYLNGADKKVYEAKSMKCESCGTMYAGESCGCGKTAPEAKVNKKGMLLDKKKLSEVLGGQ